MVNLAGREKMPTSLTGNEAVEGRNLDDLPLPYTYPLVFGESLSEGEYEPFRGYFEVGSGPWFYAPRFPSQGITHLCPRIKLYFFAGNEAVEGRNLDDLPLPYTYPLVFGESLSEGEYEPFRGYFEVGSGPWF